MMSNSEARKRLAANEARDDVETLAYALDLIDKTPRSNTYRRQAELLLASDWLAAHTAAAEARGARAVLDAVEAKSPCAAPDCRCTSRDEMRAAAREAARNAGAS